MTTNSSADWLIFKDTWKVNLRTTVFQLILKVAIIGHSNVSMSLQGCCDVIFA